MGLEICAFSRCKYAKTPQNIPVVRLTWTWWLKLHVFFPFLWKFEFWIICGDRTLNLKIYDFFHDPKSFEQNFTHVSLFQTLRLKYNLDFMTSGPFWFTPEFWFTFRHFWFTFRHFWFTFWQFWFTFTILAQIFTFNYNSIL